MNWIKLSALIFLTTISGILIHGLGYYSTARLLGYSVRMNYSGVAFPECKKEAKEKPNLRSDHRLMAICGNLTTIFLGGIGLLMFVSHNKKKRTLFSAWGLFSLSLTLHCLWFLAIYVLALFYFVFFGTQYYGVETVLALDLGINEFWIITPFALLGLAVLIYISYCFYKQQQLKMFLITLPLVGCATYVVWFYFLGKAILP